MKTRKTACVCDIGILYPSVNHSMSMTESRMHLDMNVQSVLVMELKEALLLKASLY